MNARWVTPLVALVGLVGCNLIVIADGEVDWTLQAGTTCQMYGISQWAVTVQGPDAIPTTMIPCSTAGDYTSGVFHAAEGTYTATVRALGSTGAQIGVPRGPVSATILSRYGLTHLNVGIFTATDLAPTFTCGNSVCESSAGETCQNCPADCACGTCGNGTCEPGLGETCGTCPTDCSCSTSKLHAMWSINGTEDGTDDGLSWDTCDEVQASYVRIGVDGSPSDLPCGGSSKQAMNTASAGGDISVAAGTHTITVQLLDAGKNNITSQASSSQTFGTGNVLSMPVNFNWDAFVGIIKTQTTGWYLFATTFEGKSCQQANWLQSEISMLYLNGSPVSNFYPQVCDQYQNCYTADGNSTGKCSDTSRPQTMQSSSLIWGSYKLKLQATLIDKSACYSVGDQSNGYETDILIGAGHTNPVVLHDLSKLASAAAGCL